MIISISGPTSTGKTTLIHKFREQFPEYVYIEENFRELVKQKVDFTDPEKAFLFQYDLCLKINMPVTDVNQVYIMDRSSFDAAAYTTLHFLRLDDETKKKYIDKYVEAILRCRLLMKDIDYIFLTPAKSDIIDDGFRPDIYHALRDDEIKIFDLLIENVHKKYCRLPDDIDNQIFTLTNCISRYN